MKESYSSDWAEKGHAKKAEREWHRIYWFRRLAWLRLRGFRKIR